jgi:hypothetical protein
MKFENGVVIQQCPVGLVKIDISRKEAIKYTCKEDNYLYLYDGIIYPCEIEFDVHIKRGWTFALFFNEDIVKQIIKEENVLLTNEYVVWDINGQRILV